MNNEYYDMGFKDGFKKALREQKEYSDLTEQANPGGSFFPPGFDPMRNSEHMQIAIRFWNSLNTIYRQGTPQVREVLGNPQHLMTLMRNMGLTNVGIRHMGMIGQDMQRLAGNQLNGGLFANIRSNIALFRTLAAVPMGGAAAVAVTSSGLTLSQIMAAISGTATATLAAILGSLLMLGTAGVLFANPEIIEDFINDMFPDIFGPSPVDLRPDQIRPVDPNKPKFDTSGGIPPLKAISPGDPGYDDISNQAGGPAYPRYPRGR